MGRGEGAVWEVAEQPGVGGYERDVEVVGEGDEFAVVGGAGGVGHEAEDVGGVDVVFFVEHHLFGAFHCLKCVFVCYSSSPHVTCQSTSEL